MELETLILAMHGKMSPKLPDKAIKDLKAAGLIGKVLYIEFFAGEDSWSEVPTYGKLVFSEEWVSRLMQLENVRAIHELSKVVAKEGYYGIPEHEIDGICLVVQDTGFYFSGYAGETRCISDEYKIQEFLSAVLEGKEFFGNQLDANDWAEISGYGLKAVEEKMDQ